MKDIIEFNQISFKYNQTNDNALDNVSLNIKQGECVVLCGLSGCGKSTLLRFINGLIHDYYHGDIDGEYSVDGLCYINSTVSDFSKIVGSVFQNPKTQYFNANSSEELAFPCENIGMPTNEIKDRIASIAKEFNIEHLLDREIYKMSGGEKQKLAFVCACILNPKILVLDEPTSNLDNASIKELSVLIKKMKEKGTTIIISEHRLYWLKDIADRYILLNHSKVKEWSSTVFNSLTNKQRADYGLRTNSILNYINLLKEKEKEINEDILLEVDNLNIGYKNKLIKSAISFKVKENEILGIVGHNGVGKTTLIKTMCGLIKSLDGHIKYKGKSLNQKELLKHSFLVMQDVNYQLFSDSVKEEILLNNKDLENYEEILKSLNLYDLQERHPISLSGGQKQRLMIACAMCCDKDILYLDEPTSGLDYLHMQAVGKLLNKAKENNKTIIVVSHDEEFLALWCDRIVRLED